MMRILVAATNRNFVQEISAGRFRADLYHRVAGFMIKLPPLRSGVEDIAFLAELFLAKTRAELGRDIEPGADVAEDLARRDWPGNVRELQQVVQRSA